MTGLLLDEMLTPRIGEQLRARGDDAYGIVERPDLRALTDADVLELATSEGRTLVTGNIADFAILNATWGSQGRVHGGIVYLTAAKFPQNRAFIGAVVAALDRLLAGGFLPPPGSVAFL